MTTILLCIAIIILNIQVVRLKDKVEQLEGTLVAVCKELDRES